ncbi:MAG: hypothetical protein WDZ29_03275 [Balneolaceae bacterium]
MKYDFNDKNYHREVTRLIAGFVENHQLPDDIYFNRENYQVIDFTITGGVSMDGDSNKETDHASLGEVQANSDVWSKLSSHTPYLWDKWLDKNNLIHIKSKSDLSPEQKKEWDALKWETAEEALRKLLANN